MTFENEFPSLSLNARLRTMSDEYENYICVSYRDLKNHCLDRQRVKEVRAEGWKETIIGVIRRKDPEMFKSISAELEKLEHKEVE